MEITRSHVFDAPIAKVWAMFADRESHVAKFETMGHREIEVLECTEDDTNFSIRIKRKVTIDVPGFAKKVIKPTSTVTSIDEWHLQDDGSCSGEYRVDADAPIEVSGKTRVQPKGDDQSEYTVVVDIKVNVPLIGKRIASFAKGDVDRQMRDEFACGDRWLAEH